MANCDVCGFEIQRYDDIASCSEFCASTTKEEQSQFKRLKPGDDGVWPCSECGIAIEGDYTVGGHCSRCHPKVQLRTRTELLRETLPHLPADLATRVLDEIGDA